MKGRRREVLYAQVDWDFAPVFVAVSGGKIFRISIGRSEEEFLRELESKWGTHPVRKNLGLNPFIKPLRDYLSGQERKLDIPIKFMEGTPFQRAVWKALMEIPWGEVRSYKWVAERVGAGKGYRAVGAACGANPLPIIVPCHRVISASGRIGGYSGGVEVKVRLLQLEGHELKGSRVLQN